MNTHITVREGTTVPGGTQSLQRAMALVQALTRNQRKGGTAAQLAIATGIDRSTAHRMLQCLAASELLHFDTVTRKYHFGRLAHEIGFAASEHVDFTGLSKPALARISEDTGDTVFLMMRSGDDAVCADRYLGVYAVQPLAVTVGTRRPLGIGCGSLAMLSSLPPHVADLCLHQNEPRIAAFDGMSVERIQSMLQVARSNGYVAMDVINVSCARSVSAPVISKTGRPVAALSVSGMAARMSTEREQALGHILQTEAKALGKAFDERFATV
ncbi:IclR family transcriptional regulator [Diaphorobacter sp. HDW4A]|uniref:IclR family transcriptional regulator n=1 Tax=Diaphorobacter sp. HDW4A TaxID=2714924 RepID=UPI001F103A99|nr:IclR family transcriptional regulator [Diaphorobacter sp. HDW4A]